MTRCKKKKDPDDEVTRLQKQVRELKALNRSLMKRLKKLDREYEEPKDIDIEDINEDLDTMHMPLCQECGKGSLKTVVISQRSWQKCDTCTYRSKATKL